jgi:hypothetical protein
LVGGEIINCLRVSGIALVSINANLAWLAFSLVNLFDEIAESTRTVDDALCRFFPWSVVKIVDHKPI